MHRRYRNGIFLLVILCVLLCFFIRLQVFLKIDSKEPIAYTKHHAKFSAICSQDTNVAERTLFRYSVNHLNDYSGYVLGLTISQINSIKSYRASNKWIRSWTDFVNLVKPSVAQQTDLKARLKFPSFKTVYNYQKTAQEFSISKKDLNLVEAKELVDFTGVPMFIAMRIVAYRAKIGGYRDVMQLKDVYGLYDRSRTKITERFAVKKEISFPKVTLQHATLNELMAVPYISFEMALDVKDYIKENKEVLSFYEFDKIKGFNRYNIERISLYLKL